MKRRESNFELMRLISMLMIVMWHILVHGYLLSNGNDATMFTNRFILAILVVHVNSLVFLTGYFNEKKENVNLKRCFKLIGEVWFYKALIVGLFLVLNLVKINKITIIEELLPLDFNNYWFINSYLILYLLSPFLNKVIKNMSEKEFFKFLLILLLLFTILPIISQGRIISNNGSNLTNFIIIYYLGAFFHKYPISQNYYFKKLSRKNLQRILIISFFMFTIINISLNCLGERIYSIDNNLFQYVGRIIQINYTLYSNPIVIIQSCCYCLLFETFKFNNKFINFIAGSTFGVYLIHDNHLMRQVIYKWVDYVKTPSTIKSLGILLLSTIIIFTICFIIETIRRLLAKGIKIGYTKIRRKKLNGEG